MYDCTLKEKTLIDETFQEHGLKAESNLDAQFSAFYLDLKRLAGGMLWRNLRSETIQATALVHEVFFKFKSQRNQNFQNKQQFMSISARLMQRILIDRAREKLAEKRGGQLQREELETSIPEDNQDIEQFLAVNDCIEKLTIKYERPAQVLKLHFFLGLEIQEISDVLEISTATTKRDLAFAKAWLSEALK